MFVKLIVCLLSYYCNIQPQKAQAEDIIRQVILAQHIHKGPVWIESIKCSNCTLQIIITLGGEYRGC